MRTRAPLLLLAAVVAAAVSSQASATLGTPGASRPDTPYSVHPVVSEGQPAVEARGPAVASQRSVPGAALPEPPAVTAAASGREEGFDGAASVLMLVGFLGLIGVNLVRWSGDASCKSERSVF